jgi:hypothetical protein
MLTNPTVHKSTKENKGSNNTYDKVIPLNRYPVNNPSNNGKTITTTSGVNGNCSSNE